MYLFSHQLYKPDILLIRLSSESKCAGCMLMCWINLRNVARASIPAETVRSLARGTQPNAVMDSYLGSQLNSLSLFSYR